MKKKIILSMAVLATVVSADVKIGAMTIPNPVLNNQYLSIEKGGTKSMIDAYSDGIGVIVVGDTSIKADNSPTNILVYKYGSKAKEVSQSLADYVLADTTASAEDKELAQKMKDDLAASIYPTEGGSCDDGDPNTIGDIYTNGVCSGNIPLSCKDILDNGASNGNGVYNINNGSKTYPVYCDMTYAGGGWTLVAAQYETDVTNGWNEGIQSDYDPSLSTKKAFVLNSAELPSDRTQMSMGKDLNDKVDYFNFVYITENIDKTLVSGVNADYHIHRNTSSFYSSHDPENSLSNNSTWNNTLTIDQTGVDQFTWAFCPQPSTSSYRGYAYKGSLGTSLQSYAWTVWVR